MLIDFHAHIYPPEIWKKVINSLEDFYGVKARWDATFESLFKSMDGAGVEKAVILPVPTKKEHVESNNRYYADLSRKYSRLIPFGAVHPDYSSHIVDSFPELGFKGFKVQPNAWRVRPDDSRLSPFYAKAEKMNLLVVFHTGDEEGGVEGKYSRPNYFLPVLEEFSSLKCVFAHLGGYKRWDEAEVLYSYPNAYFDTSYTSGVLPAHKFVEIVNKLRDRVVFGTDFPFRDHREEKEYILKYLGREFLTDIEDNAVKLLGIKDS